MTKPRIESIKRRLKYQISRNRGQYKRAMEKALQIVKEEELSWEE